MRCTSAPVVLLVQADVDSREMYTEFLRYHGLVVVPVATARDGLALAPNAHVIVTSLRLPGDMEGVEFVARLKRDERTTRIPVIVLTACAWKTDRERAEDAGCDVFLAKPCLPDHLLRQVGLLLDASKLRDVRGLFTAGDLSGDVPNCRERAADWNRG